MTELAVRVQYKTIARNTTLGFLRGTFPFWGVASPVIAGITCGFSVAVLCGANFGISDLGQAAAMFFGSVTVLAMFVCGLLLTNWLSRDCLIVDKDGLQLPFNPFDNKRNLPWSAVSHLRLSPATADNWRVQELLVFSRLHKRPVRIDLANLQSEQVEQMLIGIEMWAKGCEIDQNVHDLKHAINKNSTQAISYTEFWEDELRRRFGAVNFVPLEPNQVLRNGSLRVVRQLALGGLSAVYLCQLDEKKLVVLKEAVVADDAKEAAQAKAREMLNREATLLLKLSHPSIVKVMDHFVEQGRNYLMLEYISGQDLRQFIEQNGPQRDSIVIEWGLHMAQMLKYLHEQEPPILHRDFTPDNIVLREDGSLIVIDFGASNEFIGTATGTFVGKHAFIAPEQFRGNATAQSDIYALGCTLYFLLTGQEPEALSTSNPGDVNSYINKELCDVVVSCTQMEEKDRFQSAAQLIPVLKGLAASLPMIG